MQASEIIGQLERFCSFLDNPVKLYIRRTMASLKFIKLVLVDNIYFLESSEEQNIHYFYKKGLEHDCFVGSIFSISLEGKKEPFLDFL